MKARFEKKTNKQPSKYLFGNTRLARCFLLYSNTFGEAASRPGSDFYDAGAVEVYAFANSETITKNFKKIITAAGRIFDEAGGKMLFVFDGNKIKTFCRA